MEDTKASKAYIITKSSTVICLKQIKIFKLQKLAFLIYFRSEMSLDNQINVFYVIQTKDTSKPITNHDSSPAAAEDTVDEEPSDLKKIYSCQFCPSQFDRVLSLYGHLNTHKNEVFPCTVENCQQTFTSLKAFRKHISGIHFDKLQIY